MIYLAQVTLNLKMMTWWLCEQCLCVQCTLVIQHKFKTPISWQSSDTQCWDVPAHTHTHTSCWSHSVFSFGNSVVTMSLVLLDSCYSSPKALWNTTTHSLNDHLQLAQQNSICRDRGVTLFMVKYLWHTCSCSLCPTLSRRSVCRSPSSSPPFPFSDARGHLCKHIARKEIFFWQVSIK